MYDDELYYYEEERKRNAKSETALAGTFGTAIGGILGIVISCILFLINCFDVLSSGLASLLCYIFTYKQGWDKKIYIAMSIVVFLISIILQHSFVIARIIYTIFVCVVVALLGACWKTYDTVAQRYTIMAICFAITAFLGFVSWCGISNNE